MLPQRVQKPRSAPGVEGYQRRRACGSAIATAHLGEALGYRRLDRGVRAGAAGAA